MPNARPFQVMAKPGGPACNLACSYCYYLEKRQLYPETARFRMGDEVLETFIRDSIASQVRLGAPEIWLSWQGGEPTVLGVDFFRRVLELEARHSPPGSTVRNALQTNGILIDAGWAGFLRENRFLVGLSIDGPRPLHDAYRVDRRGRPTFGKAAAALDLMLAEGVECNTLTVVHRRNARRAREVYRFLKGRGVRFMQFIPLVERSSGGPLLAGAPQVDPAGEVTPWSVSPEGYGEFLCELFDEWIKNDVGRIFVQFFDAQLGLWMGRPSSLCWFAETCGQGLALEHNGDLYACDHYVYPEYRLGNILETPLEDLAASPEQRRFGDAKRDALPQACRECEMLFACRGGCPKHRFLEATDGEPGLNYFCASYQRFFAHAGERLKVMADLVSHGMPADLVMSLPS
jgi:uncharacterized protein